MASKFKTCSLDSCKKAYAGYYKNGKYWCHKTHYKTAKKLEEEKSKKEKGD